MINFSEAINASLGKTIARVSVEYDELMFRFTDTTGLRIRDAGQQCCEERYMVTDDTPEQYQGAKFMGVMLGDVGGDGDHEIQFLDVKTSNGVLTVQTHNEHNGCYGGFSISAQAIGAGE